MKRSFQDCCRHRQRGSVAVETALVFTFLMLFATLPSIYWAIYFYQYSTAQKALHSAALYLATAPKLEMTTAGADGNPVALTVAKKIIASQMVGLNPSEPGIDCSYRQTSGQLVARPCSTTNNRDYKQTLVQITVSFNLSYINPLTGHESDLRISPYIPVLYTGN